MLSLKALPYANHFWLRRRSNLEDLEVNDVGTVSINRLKQREIESVIRETEMQPQRVCACLSVSPRYRWLRVIKL